LRQSAITHFALDFEARDLGRAGFKGGNTFWPAWDLPTLSIIKSSVGVVHFAIHVTNSNSRVWWSPVEFSGMLVGSAIGCPLAITLSNPPILLITTLIGSTTRHVGAHPRWMFLIAAFSLEWLRQGQVFQVSGDVSVFACTHATLNITTNTWFKVSP
jgi:hypothetical protein